MLTAPILEDEKQRIAAVHHVAILDTEPEVRFDNLTHEAVEKLSVPISTISIIDTAREWFKSCVGLDAKEGERAISFCGHALYAKDIFIVEDTLLDERFVDNPMVVGPPFIRFYAGIALLDHQTTQPVGVFCVKDKKPRTLTMQEIDILTDIANRAEEALNN